MLLERASLFNARDRGVTLKYDIETDLNVPHVAVGYSDV